MSKTVLEKQHLLIESQVEPSKKTLDAILQFSKVVKSLKSKKKIILVINN